MSTAGPKDERDDFTIGGIDRQLSEDDKLEQLGSWMDAHHAAPDNTPPWAGGLGNSTALDGWVARLPDRLTHGAMLMLGSGLDHSAPGVAFADSVATEKTTLSDGTSAMILRPEKPADGSAIISLHPGGWWAGSGEALEFQFRPEAAALAALSGVEVIDVDYPLAPDHTVADTVSSVRAAAQCARSCGTEVLGLWGQSSGAALGLLVSDEFDAQVLTFPDLDSLARLPEQVRGDAALPDPAQWPKTLVQIATHDEVAARPAGLDQAGTVAVSEYPSRHRIATPEINRRRLADAGRFLSEAL